MDRRFLALIAATFVMAFAVCWMWFAPAAPATAPGVDAAPAAAASPVPVAASPAASQNPTPPPAYEPPPDPTIVHRLG